MTPLTQLWRDEYLIAIHKPAGWLVHRTGLDAGETRFIVQTLRDQLGGQRAMAFEHPLTGAPVALHSGLRWDAEAGVLRIDPGEAAPLDLRHWQALTDRLPVSAG